MITFDLKTLPDWETLATGKHILNIVAIAENLIDSDKSDPIEFEAPPDYLCFTAEEAGSTVAMAVKGTPHKGQAFETSTDGTNWSVFTPGTTTITLAKTGDKVYFRGDNTTVSESSSIYYKFVMSGKIAASGNIMSLLDKTCQSTTISNNYCYQRMFYGCKSLTTAPELPATTLAMACYNYMFYGCTSLTTGPSILPATTLEYSCYQRMFYGCKSLTTAPELPATTLADYCYNSMFDSCTSLTAAPELPATKLESSCYYDMFLGCTSLTTGPSILPATTLADYCYTNMFYGCTSLTTAPALPATTLADYCYNSMFDSCTSLTAAPALPATTLKRSCYSKMFQRCTSLTTAPELPATTLADYCYSNMFQGCEGLKISATQTGEYTTAWRIPSTGEIAAAATNWNTNMLVNTGGTFKRNPSINTTYYIAA